jgi:hypothetical protein
MDEEFLLKSLSILVAIDAAQKNTARQMAIAIV